MGCEQCREALSARLDGEDDPAGRVAVDAHVRGCAGCRQWLQDATAVTRLARIGLPLPAPGVPESVLDAAPGPGRSRAVAVLRLTLGGLAAAQLLLAVAQIANPANGATAMTGHTQGASGNHLLHESAAWNIAVGVGFLVIAWRRARPAGQLPVLTAFVAALALLSAGDLVTAEVSWSRLASHLLLVAGYILVVVLSRPGMSLDTPPGPSRPGRSRWAPPRFEEDIDRPAAPVRTAPPAETRDHDAA